MNIVSQPQTVANSDALSSDQRVNYEFGLVLGVNEFRQEQAYFLEKNYLYNRGLHGFGTVSGLKVTLQTPGSNIHEREITIEPGLAIDQWGRSIVVSNTLCAHLQAWLAKQDQDTDTSKHVASHLNNNQGQVYITASYQAYPTTLVPVAGQGCNSDSTSVASRIQDSYTIELTWTKPALPAWDAEHCFAQLLAQIRFMPETDASDEQQILTYLRQLDQSCPEAFPGTLSQDFLQLPAIWARETLDRIFTVWVTEVLPKLHPNQLQPSSDATMNNPAILLTTIDLTLQKGTDTSTPWLISNAILSDEGRPFLLNTQLIQETLLQNKLPEPEREFATFQVREDHTLRLWLHYPNPVPLHSPVVGDISQIQVQSEDTTLTIQSISAVPNTSNVFDITVKDVIVSGARLAITFTLNAIQVRDSQGHSQLLQTALETLNFAYVGHDRVANSISVYTIAESTPAQTPTQTSAPTPAQTPTQTSAPTPAQTPTQTSAPTPAQTPTQTSAPTPAPAQLMPVLPFITVTPLSTSQNKLELELWFHPNLDPHNNNVLIQDAAASTAIPERVVTTIDTNISNGSGGTDQTNVFTMTLTLPPIPNNNNITLPNPFQFPVYLRLLFPVDLLKVYNAAQQIVTLREYMQQEKINFEGYNRNDAIVTYVSIRTA